MAYFNSQWPNWSNSKNNKSNLNSDTIKTDMQNVIDYCVKKKNSRAYNFISHVLSIVMWLINFNTIVCVIL